MARGRALLLADGCINLVLGALLVAFPASVVEILGVPTTQSAFYPSILGAVLFGIGVALFLQFKGLSGLGLQGAIAINLCGGFVLGCWLAFGSLALPIRGFIFLWSFVAVLIGLSAVELLANGKEDDA
jgi:NO-binding membrane sensor protein with MHYT domain